ncbi:guanine(37)-N1-methyltransferase [Syncephalastrum racemosum]|uniref:tRNA (guanine(37)-N1)-methyltransferase n=1 Tax=Syncephalastrum racemosum TaxID=13706 RepID=A0A1X2HV42_SYNRA|nr:guanine(37)-N1-methyltransferase [Syncephalastrum racemosum]
MTALFRPPVHRGMTALNREAFKTTYQVKAIRVPVKKVKDFMKTASDQLLNQPRYPNVAADPTSKDNKLLLLKNGFEKDDVPSSIKSLVDNPDFVTHTVELDYGYWTAEQILHAVMPENATDIPSSFTQIGHIAHMNLREDYLPWKHLIGEVILDKNKNITAVVNKTDSIDTTFRFFKMELLAGENNMIAQVKESGCIFKFDFSRVYWNSRLQTEHDRLIKKFKKDEYICDVFGGVGPFALPAAKKGCRVYANDLNPESFRWLQENIKINKIMSGIKSYNLDGSAFIQQAAHDLQATSKEWKAFDHVVMNLPATAIEFLGAFRGIYRERKSLYEAAADPKLPTIHCHCFSKSQDPTRDIFDRVKQAIGLHIDESRAEVHLVRNVAPKKNMYCISFPLTPEIAFAAPR